MFVLESRDWDSEVRNFAPVKLTSETAVDLLVPTMDHGWCFGYTCQKRLSTFWATVSMGQNYAINMTGTPPTITRIWIPYAPLNEEITLAIRLRGPNQRFLFFPSYPGASFSGLHEPWRTTSECLNRAGDISDASCIPQVCLCEMQVVELH